MDDPAIRNNRIYDANLGDNNFSDESDVDVSVVSVVPKISKNPSSLLLTLINKAWRQRRRGKEVELDYTSSQSTVQSTTVVFTNFTIISHLQGCQKKTKLVK